MSHDYEDLEGVFLVKLNKLYNIFNVCIQFCLDGTKGVTIYLALPRLYKILYSVTLLYTMYHKIFGPLKSIAFGENDSNNGDSNIFNRPEIKIIMNTDTQVINESSEGNLEITKSLIEQGADVNAKDEF